MHKFIKNFEKIHIASDCIDLPDADMNTPEGKGKIQKENPDLNPVCKICSGRSRIDGREIGYQVSLLLIKSSVTFFIVLSSSL